jgi:hypothetical protein
MGEWRGVTANRKEIEMAKTAKAHAAVAAPAKKPVKKAAKPKKK